MANGWKKDYLRYKEFFLNIINVYYSRPNLRIYLELMLSIVAIIVFSVFAIRPTVLTILELNNEIKSKQDLIGKLQQKTRDLETANNLFSSSTEDIKLIDQAVPDNSSPDIFIKKIEELAKNNSLQILAFSMADVSIKGQESKNELPFTISVTGTYSNINLFLENLEKQIRPAIINSFTINSVIVDGSKKLTLLLDGKLPYLNQDEKK